MSATTRSYPFEPRTGSTVSKQAHKVGQSLRSWLYINIIFRCYLYVRGLFEEPESPGPQRYDKLIEPAKLRKRWNVHVEDYPLRGEPRDDPALGLREWKLKQITPLHHSPIARTVVYWNGGGYVSGSTPQHIAMMCRLAVDLNARVIAIPYELAPFTILALNFARFVGICTQVAQEARSQGHELVFAGDSAGAGIATGMIRALLELQPRQGKGLSTVNLMPDQLFLITPWLDGTLSQSDSAYFKRTQVYDYWLKGASLQDWARQWVGDETARRNALKLLPSSFSAFLPAPDGASHPYVSPALDNEHFKLLAAHDISVSLSLGTRDILSLDSYLYLGRLEEAGIRAHYVEGIGGMHLYPLRQAIGLPESSTAIDWMVAATKRFSRHTNQ